MRRKQSLIIFSLLFFFLIHGLFSQPIERYFDKASNEEIKNQLHLVIFYPSVGTLRALLSLEDNGFINLKEIIVIGVFHSLEKTRYGESIRFIKEKHLSNFHFHRIEAEIDQKDLFRQNSWTKEFKKIFEKSHGMIFFGGPDIPPFLYGEKTSLLTQIEDPWRHYLELSFLFHLLGGYQNENFKPFLTSKPDYPILGICLGGQSINVATGGSLTQDITWEIYGLKTIEELIALGESAWHTNPYHRLYPDSKNNYFAYELHPIKLLPEGKFCRELGFKPDQKPRVLSAHHQQAKKLGKGLKIIATSVDGQVVEALEHEFFPNVLALQFHPEFPLLWDKEARYRFRPDDQQLMSPRSILEKSPPSIEFHQKLWSWFMNKLRASMVSR
ncbi:MAG: gamma-glutamyl-gamma-aminobutyrate hydrolase family protein [Candidatus Aminicenantes bacterium]|nr:gamma-glutamyl-gamma-aminobutyrate hydrolase family protein [Candidatus Aminicenantes bacterium]